MSRTGRSPGFTLVEVIVVVVLVALVAGLALPSFGGGLGEAAPDDSTVLIRAGRRDAVDSGLPVRVEVEGRSVLLLPDGRVYGVDVDALTGRSKQGSE